MITVANVQTYRGSMTAAFYVGRPTIYGSPFPLKGPDALPRDLAVEAFKEYWHADAQAPLRARAWDELQDVSVLLCWCAPLPCHAGIIATWLNEERTRRATTIR